MEHSPAESTDRPSLCKVNKTKHTPVARTLKQKPMTYQLPPHWQYKKAFAQNVMTMRLIGTENQSCNPRSFHSIPKELHFTWIFNSPRACFHDQGGFHAETALPLCWPRQCPTLRCSSGTPHPGKAGSRGENGQGRLYVRLGRR